MIAPKKILILRFSSLGDIIMGTPMIRCLRDAHPDAQIDMIVRDDFLDLICENPRLDQKIGLPRSSGLKGLIQLCRKINRSNYDLIYDAHRSLRTLLMMPFLKAKAKCYFKKHYIRRSLALTLKLPLLRNQNRMMEKYIEPLLPWGVKFDGIGPEIFVGSETQKNAEEKLKLPSVNSNFIGFIPSAQWPGKRWPLRYFRELLVDIVHKTSFIVIVFGGKSDAFCVELCKDLDPKRVINAQGRLSIAESAAIMKHCHFVIANDTGLMHVADALNIPSVLVLGPTSKELGCLPFHPNSAIVEERLWCRPCSKNGQAPCIRGKRYCLEGISPQRVFGEAVGLSQRLESVHAG